MANGDRQSIRYVSGFGDGGEIEEAGHHLLNLMLFGPAVTDNCRFDRQRCILCNFQPGVGRGEHGDPTHLPEFKCRLYVRRVEDVFDGHAIWSVFRDELLQTLEDVR